MPTSRSLKPDLKIRWLGSVSYGLALERQHRMLERQCQGAEPDALWLLEHDHVFTLGRSADPSHVLWDPAERAVRGVEVFRSDRGGDVTYHGPGQLVAYPLIDLARARRNVVDYVRGLERSLIAVLATFGVKGYVDPPYTGVWTEKGKIGAIGVRASRNRTMHGAALNLSCDMSYFGGIVPCGLAGRPVTSAAAFGVDVGVLAAAGAFSREFCREFGFAPSPWEGIAIESDGDRLEGTTIMHSSTQGRAGAVMRSTPR